MLTSSWPTKILHPCSTIVNICYITLDYLCYCKDLHRGTVVNWQLFQHLICSLPDLYRYSVIYRTKCPGLSLLFYQLVTVGCCENKSSAVEPFFFFTFVVLVVWKVQMDISSFTLFCYVVSMFAALFIYLCEATYFLSLCFILTYQCSLLEKYFINISVILMQEFLQIKKFSY